MSGYADDDYDRDERDRDRDRDERGERGRGRDEDIIRTAKGMVTVPAIGLIVVAVFGFLSVIGGLIQYATLDAQFDEQIKQMEAQPNVPADQKKEQVRIMNLMRDWFKIGWLPFYGLVGLFSVVTLIGGIKLMSLSGPGWAKSGAILSMIPCSSGCCFLGLIFGIWAMVAMGKPEVKAGFAAKRRAAYNPDSY